MREAKVETLFRKMKIGEVYRRSDLEKYSAAVDRHLEVLVKANKVMRVSAGLYVRPQTSAFGAVPPDDKALVSSFLKDDRFLVTSYNNYTQLGLGLTQLYNNQIVYNYKRFGEFELAGRHFFFKRVPKFPSHLSKEFLLVDMLNNLKSLAEDELQVIENFLKLKGNFNAKKVLALAKEYARPRTKKLLEKAYVK